MIVEKLVVKEVFFLPNLFEFKQRLKSPFAWQVPVPVEKIVEDITQQNVITQLRPVNQNVAPSNHILTGRGAGRSARRGPDREGDGIVRRSFCKLALFHCGEKWLCK